MNDTRNRYEQGVIHGRFQILHRDHLNYLLAGKALCNHLVVGITNPDPSRIREETADPRRSGRTANPLSYFERYQLVRAALKGEGLGFDDFSVVPLPIHDPQLYPYYVPIDAVFFLSIYDDWGRQKKKYFEMLNLNVHVLREVKPEDKGISGTDVRWKMAHGQPWEHLVPKAVAVLLKKWNVPQRL